MQLTSALMVIKRAANGRFTLLLVCARDTMCPVGHIPVNGAIAGTREDAMTCPFALRAADGGGFAASAVPGADRRRSSAVPAGRRLKIFNGWG
jgi:hypothetical protein